MKKKACGTGIPPMGQTFLRSKHSTVLCSGPRPPTVCDRACVYGSMTARVTHTVQYMLQYGFVAGVYTVCSFWLFNTLSSAPRLSGTVIPFTPTRIWVLLWSSKVRAWLSVRVLWQAKPPCGHRPAHTQLLPEETRRQERVVLWCLPSMMGYTFFFYPRGLASFALLSLLRVFYRLHVPACVAPQYPFSPRG